MEGSVLKAQGKDSPAGPVLIHEEVEGKVLYKELDIMFHGLTVESVEHRMSSSVSSTGTSVGLPSLPKVQGLAAEGSLVDLAILSPREWKAIVFQLTDSLGGLPAHVLDSVLVPKPVTALDGVVAVDGVVAEGVRDPDICAIRGARYSRMPPPVVL